MVDSLKLFQKDTTRKGHACEKRLGWWWWWWMRWCGVVWRWGEGEGMGEGRDPKHEQRHNISLPNIIGKQNKGDKTIQSWTKQNGDKTKRALVLLHELPRWSLVTLRPVVVVASFVLMISSSSCSSNPFSASRESSAANRPCVCFASLRQRTSLMLRESSPQATSPFFPVFCPLDGFHARSSTFLFAVHLTASPRAVTSHLLLPP